MRYLWYSMYGFVTALAIYSLFFRPTPGPEPSQPVPDPDARIEQVVSNSVKADVQIALILDTSSSMDGLVAQARTQLFEMVSEMQTDAKNNERTVAVALYQYGNNRLAKKQGFIEQLTPLTTDLDLVAVQLHSLRTNGGKEYAPQAILQAVDELAWNSDDSVERIIVIAGNEGFNQGSIRVTTAMDAAANKKISVLPIFCANQGASATAISTWRRAANLAGTDFESIDPDQRVARAETPFDREILDKYQALEESKIYLAGQGPSRHREQAGSLVEGGVAVDRAVVQSRYKDPNAIGAYIAPGASAEASLDRIPAMALPAEVRSKSKKAQADFIRQNQAEQTKLKKEISELNRKRKNHLRLGQKKSVAGYSNSNLGESFKRNARKRR